MIALLCLYNKPKNGKYSANIGCQMSSTPPDSNNKNIHNRISALKSRLCAKKNTADELFYNITNNDSLEFRLYNQLKTIRDLLQKQQDKDGDVGNVNG